MYHSGNSIEFKKYVSVQILKSDRTWNFCYAVAQTTYAKIISTVAQTTCAKMISKFSNEKDAEEVRKKSTQQKPLAWC